jgi:hypothetical protein
MDQCAPGVRWDGKTCFSIEALKNIANKCNLKYDSQIDTNLGKEELYNEIEKVLKGICKGETCWIEKLNGQHNSNINKYHKPIRPEGSSWLSNIDIRDVLKQYQDKYHDFMLFGPYPIDFQEIASEIANIDLLKLHQKGVRKIGVVYNTDPHYKSGQHWICTYLDLNNKSHEFFDSVGDEPMIEIKQFMDKIKGLAKEQLKINIENRINKIQHQYANNECGVYAINYIVERLNGKSFDEIVNNKVKDEEMNARRDKYFRQRGGRAKKSKKKKNKSRLIRRKHRKSRRNQKANVSISKRKKSRKHRKTKRKIVRGKRKKSRRI